MRGEALWHAVRVGQAGGMSTEGRRPTHGAIYMSYGMEISATGALAAIHRQDALTANLANLNTVGFKPILTGTMHRQAVRQEDGLMNWPSDALLERLGGGVLAAPTRIDFSQGGLDETGNELDVAIQGEGFFVVGDPSSPSLTRDGRFTMDSGGSLVMASTGLPVLDGANRPIVLDPAGGPVTINTDGLIAQGGVPVATIRVADVPDRDVLKKIGQGLFAHESGHPLVLIGADGMVRHRTVELSAVNEIDALMDITSASKSAQSNIGMIDMQNRLLDRLVNTFARIS